ncbi:MAG: alpha/beta hydrolase [Pseudorhodoplanes sp.]|nr:alpha/beta hydrolase [Pseudorhodoplanes sp.]MCQ3944094.1 alpha/beta hydrolase [Alphaproteobacteria bacterium]GIK81918.1 MAG: putative hydrolase [Alphaproteobacteria bacterium]
MTRHVSPQTTTFTGASGNRLVADIFGDRGPPVLLAHGGGQTRYAWGATAAAIARTGHVAYAIDQRGHGDSEWVADGAYAFENFAADLTAVATRLTADCGHAPVAIGASLGGIASLLAEGEAARAGRSLLAALVLVDIAPRVDGAGVERIQDFMRAHAREGFATIEDAAQAVADYLPHRPRPKSTAGLKKNLRLSPDGRWRWHWDPRFMDGPGSVRGNRERTEAMLVEAARRLRIPALLVRGGSSELVHEAHVKEFLALAPHAEYTDVSGARHMVAGDQNDDFSVAVIDFLGRLDRRAAMQSAIFSQ